VEALSRTSFAGKIIFGQDIETTHEGDPGGWGRKIAMGQIVVFQMQNLLRMKKISAFYFLDFYLRLNCLGQSNISKILILWKGLMGGKVVICSHSLMVDFVRTVLLPSNRRIHIESN
jgi:hypothetical protein